MKSETELNAELERLKGEMDLLMDGPANSPEVKEWVEKVLAIRANLSQKKH